MSTFEATVEEIVFRNTSNGWTVASVAVDGIGRISAVGVMPALNAGEQVIFEGSINNHRDYGEQIVVSSYSSVLPETASALEKYLGSGLIKGIGPKTAKLIIEYFGLEAIRIFEQEPERLSEVPGIGKKRAVSIAASYLAQNEMRQTLMFLQNQGITPSLSLRIYNVFGAATEHVLKRNPYRIADEVPGVSFKTADSIAMSMGFQPESEFRLKSGIRYVLSEALNSSGHTYLPYDLLIKYSSAMLNSEEATVDNALRSLIIDGLLVAEKADEKTNVYHKYVYNTEVDIAQRLMALCRLSGLGTRDKRAITDAVSRLESNLGITLGEEQRNAIITSQLYDVMVMTGGPGTGKTTSINFIIRLINSENKIELCAPTGRASKRMSQATGYPARTIHRLLEYTGETGGFMRNESNPLDADAVIVDEISMVDIFLMQALLRALKPGAKLIMVGDASQLPSVGAGNVLKDIISSGRIPVARLTEIFRQAQESMIVVNAHRINSGQYPIFKKDDTDFFIERRYNASDAVKSVLSLVGRRLPNYMGLNPIDGIQVLAPMKRGDAGVYALNKALQSFLNPAAPGRIELAHGDSIFRLGDKVMQIKNNYDIEWTKGSESGSGIFNGDIGVITHVNRVDGDLTVRFDDGRTAVYSDIMLDELELAYCVSVHKSQGGEFDAVVIPLLSGPPRLMTRNLLYTAVTRARRLAVIVGREDCVQEMVDNDQAIQRYSSLCRRILEA